MKLTPLTILTLLLLIFSCQKENDTKTITTEKKENEDSLYIANEKQLLTPIIDSVIKKNKFNGIISVQWKDQPIYTAVNGFSNFENKIPLQKNSEFAIASISKQFTAVLILWLQQQGKLNILDSVSTHLPAFDDKEMKSITIQQLLNHTSGLSDAAPRLTSKPGKTFNYSNKGYNYLGQIIESVSGESYTQQIEKLARTLGLHQTKTALSTVDSLFANTTIGTLKNPKPMENMPMRLADKNISLGAGGLLSTVDDLHRWNNKLYTGQVIQIRELKQFIHKSADRPHPIFGEMGYGLGIMMNLKKAPAFFHSGYVKGGPSLNIYYPKSKLSVVILSNFANESLGKKAIFKPHLELKQKLDSLHSVP